MDDLKQLGDGILARAKAILLKPKETWPVIAGEATTPQNLVMRYGLPLIILSALAGFIGMQVFGVGMFVTIRPSLMFGLTTLVTTVVMGLVAVVVIALIADWLAPQFGGQANRVQAFKLVVYSFTAGWFGGLLAIFPPLAIIGFLAFLYGIYLLYLGAGPLMEVPSEKTVGYTAVTILAAIVAMALSYFVVGMVAGPAMLSGGPIKIERSVDGSTASGTVNIPGVGSVDMGKLEAATKQMEAAAAGGAAGAAAGAAVAPSAMQALLPAAIGSWQRTAVESASASGLGGTAAGTYANGDKKFELRIVDMNALGALGGIAAAMGVEANREDAYGYERTGTVDGAMQIEEWNRTRSRGKFARIVGGRFMIEAEGDAGSIDELKAAVAAVDQGKLAGMGK